MSKRPDDDTSTHVIDAVVRHSKVRPSIPQLNAAGKSVIGGDMKIGDPAARAQGAAAFICTALIASGILIIVLSHGFFMNLLGNGGGWWGCRQSHSR